MLKGILFLFRQCWKFSKKYVVYSLMWQIIYSLFPLTAVVLPKFIIDELMGSQRLGFLIGLSALLIGYNLVGTLLESFLRGRMFTEKGSVFSAFLAMLAERLTEADLASLENPAFLDTAAKAHKFLYADGKGFAVVLDSAFNILGKTFVFIGLITVLSTLNPLLVLIFIALILIHFFAESKIKESVVKWDLEKAPIERRTNYFIRLVEGFDFGKELRIYNLRHWIMDIIRAHYRESDKFYKKQMGGFVKSFYFSAMMTFIREGITYSYLIWQIIIRNIGIGDFTMYLAATASFSGAMRDVMNSAISLKQFGGYYQAVEDYMNVPRKMREGKNLTVPECEHTIEFHDVSFRYQGQSTYALRNVCLILRPGEKISIVGETAQARRPL